MKNQIPLLLEEKSVTRYRLWKLLGGDATARCVAYGKLTAMDAANRPIPPGTQWGTLKKIALALNVGMGELEAARE